MFSDLLMLSMEEAPNAKIWRGATHGPRNATWSIDISKFMPH
jgi:hypothetical protein